MAKKNQNYVLLGSQVGTLMFGGIFDTMEEAHKRIVELVSEAYDDWFNDQYDPDYDTTLEDFIEQHFVSELCFKDDTSEDGMYWEIKPIDADAGSIMRLALMSTQTLGESDKIAFLDEMTEKLIDTGGYAKLNKPVKILVRDENNHLTATKAVAVVCKYQNANEAEFCHVAVIDENFNAWDAEDTLTPNQAQKVLENIPG